MPQRGPKIKIKTKKIDYRRHLKSETIEAYFKTQS